MRGPSLQPLGSSPPSWGRGACWDVLEEVDLCWERHPGMWDGLECFSPTLPRISSLLQAPDSITSAQVLDYVVGFDAGATLTHLSDSLNLSVHGLLGLSEWLWQYLALSGLTVIEIMSLQSGMLFSTRRGNWRRFPLCCFIMVYLLSDLKYITAVHVVVVSLLFIFFGLENHWIVFTYVCTLGLGIFMVYGACMVYPSRNE